MKVGVFTPSYNDGNRAVLEAFAAGIPGAELHDESRYVACDVMVIFGLFKRAFRKSQGKRELLRAHKGPFVVVERGYVGRGAAVMKAGDYDADGTHWSAGYGGLNGRADFRNENVLPDRWEALGVELKPWRVSDEGPVLICGQVPWDVAVQDGDHRAWVRAKIAGARRLGLEPLFRPHPHALARGADYGVDCQTSAAPMAEDLARARLVVTFNSNTGVDAAIAGVPVVAEDDGSMVRNVAARSIGAALCTRDWPDRRQWAASLGYAQWTTQEFMAGLAQRHLGLL